MIAIANPAATAAAITLGGVDQNYYYAAHILVHIIATLTATVFESCICTLRIRLVVVCCSALPTRCSKILQDSVLRRVLRMFWDFLVDPPVPWYIYDGREMGTVVQLYNVVEVRENGLMSQSSSRYVPSSTKWLGRIPPAA